MHCTSMVPGAGTDSTWRNSAAARRAERTTFMATDVSDGTMQRLHTRSVLYLARSSRGGR